MEGRIANQERESVMLGEPPDEREEELSANVIIAATAYLTMMC